MKKAIFHISAVLLFLLAFGTAVAADSPPRYKETISASMNPMSVNGAVTSPHYLATQAGIDILRRGGNAIDATIAVASTLGVLYPHANGIGGDNFWVIYNAKTGEILTLNASGRSGEKATMDFMKSKGVTNQIPYRGYLAANTVPGVVSGWDEAYNYAKKNFDNKGLPWEQLLEPSITYAEQGFPVPTVVAKWLYNLTNKNAPNPTNLQQYEGFRTTFLKADGSPYKVGEIMKLPDLAESMKLIAKDGASAFYKGSIAKKIVADLQANGGLLTENDFANHKADWVKPLSVEYRDCKIYNLPPNTQGIAALEIMNILNNFDVKKLGEGTADYFHLLAEATKEAFLDRDLYLTDPEFSPIPTDKLLSKAHGKAQAARISMEKASAGLKPLDPNGDTVWLAVVDKDGNAVSMIQSIYMNFGSSIVPKGTGVLLQNRGCFFSMDPKHVNHLEPKKRTFHTLNAAIMTKNNKPFLVYGTHAGEGQPQTQAAIATRVVDFGMYPQDAVSAPRYLFGRTSGAANNDLKVEGRVSQDILDELKSRGHQVVKVDDYTDLMGQAGAILIDPVTNVKYGANDPRSDGLAAGY